MIRRPKPGEGEKELLQMQEEFLNEKKRNQNHKPSAAFVNLSRSFPTKRSNSQESTERKPSKYAQSKGLKNHKEKRLRTEETTSCLRKVIEKNFNQSVLEDHEFDEDKVNFPKAIPSLVGEIVEKNLDCPFIDVEFQVSPEGFPAVSRHNLIPTAIDKNIDHAIRASSSLEMDIDTSLKGQNFLFGDTSNSTAQLHNFPTKSYVVSSRSAQEIHNENIKILSKLSEKDILDEQQKLLSSIDPKLIEFLKMKCQGGNCVINQDVTHKGTKTNTTKSSVDDDDDDTLWENDILSHPQINQWLHFDRFENDKLEWMKGIKISKEIKPDEPYEARFDFKGYLLPYTLEYTENTKSLFHHGDEPHRPGYSLSELIELSRSAVLQQRVMALNSIAGILEYYAMGTYKNIIEIPLSKLFFIIRYAIDENKIIILEPALRAMRNLLFNRVDEACLDSLIGFEEGNQQPCLENDKSEIEELDSNQSELKDFHLAEIDLIAAVIRTNVFQRMFYIFETVKPSFNCVQYAIQILTRLARDSVEAAKSIVESEHLLRSIIHHFLPTTGINFHFNPEIAYNGKPILSALKFIRVLCLQSQDISNLLVSKHNILKSISEYISSGCDGTYGLRLQIEAFCILTNLLQYNVGIESGTSLFPVIVTALYKHVQGTDIYIHSSMISATHAAVVLQFFNVFLCYRNLVNVDRYKKQLYPLLEEGVQKWMNQLIHSETYTCGHLRLMCSILDCCKTVLASENTTIYFLNDLLKKLAHSKCFKHMVRNLVSSSNLLSGIENNELFLTKNLNSLGTIVVDKEQKVLPLLNTQSPLPFLAALFKLLIFVNDECLTHTFVSNIHQYLESLSNKVPSLCDNWFTRVEADLLFFVVKISIQHKMPESSKDLMYAVASKLCYILRIDKRYELEYIFRNIVFNKDWFTTARLLNLVSLSETEGFSRVFKSIDDIRLCYSNVINLNYNNTGPNVVFKQWQEPILPRDWIYLPVLMLYSKSQIPSKPIAYGQDLKIVEAQAAAQKEFIISCSLEWILFYELCFPDLLMDIDVTDRFCRIMCVFLCDNSLFLDNNISVLLKKCTQILFKKNALFNFDKTLTGLNNFQDFYTQMLEQFQSVSYGDPTFAACVLVPLAQKHNVKWRQLLWSEYAGCLRCLDCPLESLCYDLNEYLYPAEADESVIRSYFKALSGNLLRPETIVHKIAKHHVNIYKTRKVIND